MQALHLVVWMDEATIHFNIDAEDVICGDGDNPVVTDERVRSQKFTSQKISYAIAVNAIIGLVHVYIISSTTGDPRNGTFKARLQLFSWHPLLSDFP